MLALGDVKSSSKKKRNESVKVEASRFKMRPSGTLYVIPFHLFAIFSNQFYPLTVIFYKRFVQFFLGLESPRFV